MKASKELQRKVAALIEPLDTPERRSLYNAGDFPRADRVNNLNVRYRWDLLWQVAATDRTIYNDFESEGLYQTHIDTLLRSVVNPIEEEA